MMEHVQGMLDAAEERERNTADPSPVLPQTFPQSEPHKDSTTDMQAHLQRLLDAAASREFDDIALRDDEGNPQSEAGMATRSHGKVFEWNPIMNAKETLIEK